MSQMPTLSISAKGFGLSNRLRAAGTRLFFA